jgi:hypothetical protein
MTGIAIVIAPEAAWIAADTLVTVPDGENTYMSKFRHFPAMNVVVAATGQAAIFQEWIKQIEQADLVDLDELNQLAEQFLPQIADAFSIQFCEPAPTTIYHIGVAPDGEVMSGWTFKHPGGFAANPLASEALIMKPEVVPPSADRIDAEFMATIIALQAVKIQGTPEEEIAGIGGDIDVICLKPDGEIKKWKASMTAMPITDL